MNLLPQRTVGGADGAGKFGTDNAVFYRVDWQWYLNMQGVSPQFGQAGDNVWDFSTDTDNFQLAPRDDTLKTPVWGVNLCLNYITSFDLFSNLGPVMLEQLGVNAGESEEVTSPIEQVLFFLPGVMHFVGADLGPVREALAGQEVRGFDRIYRDPGENGGGRRIAITEPNGVPVVTVMVDNFPIKLMVPGLAITFRHDDATAVYAEESVQWCLDELVDAPVVTGEINGGRPDFAGYPHGNRDLEPIEPFDALLFGMDVSEYAGTVQAIVSDVDGGAPEAEALGEAFAESTGEYGTRYHPNVSTISASW